MRITTRRIAVALAAMVMSAITLVPTVVSARCAQGDVWEPWKGGLLHRYVYTKARTHDDCAPRPCTIGVYSELQEWEETGNPEKPYDWFHKQHKSVTVSAPKDTHEAIAKTSGLPHTSPADFRTYSKHWASWGAGDDWETEKWSPEVHFNS